MENPFTCSKLGAYAGEILDDSGENSNINVTVS